MKLTDKISVRDFDYELPESRIAKYPLAERDFSKLLIGQTSQNIKHDSFSNLINYLPQECLLVFNNTKVVNARLIFRKSTGALIEVFCLKPLVPQDYAQAFQSTESCNWECIIGNLKRWKTGFLDMELKIKGKTALLTAKKISQLANDGSWNVEFRWNNDSFTFADILNSAGQVPIPPYLNRNAEKSDTINYQTTYSKIRGSVAAPTAGLHFTHRAFESFQKNNIKTAEITLHVGAGTFQPIKADNIARHKMHAENFFINVLIIDKLLKNPDSIIAVGTTSVRALESLYWLGVKLSKGYIPKNEIPVIEQWECYELLDDVTPVKALAAVRDYLKVKGETNSEISTSIMIVPGYRFKLINGLITNFHQPKSTLLLLIAAFAGSNWKKIYNYALENDFRFLSYGDSSLLLR